MTDAMHKTNKACLRHRVGGDQVLQESWFRYSVENLPDPTQPAALASLFYQLTQELSVSSCFNCTMFSSLNCPDVDEAARQLDLIRPERNACTFKC